MATFFGKIMGVQMIVNNLSSGLANDDEMVVADKHLQWTYIAQCQGGDLSVPHVCD